MSYGNGGEWTGPTQAQTAFLGGGAGLAPTPVERPAMARELEHHQKATEALHQVIDLLIQRLDPILSPTQPQNPTGGVDAQRTASQVVTMLRAHGYRIDGATSRLNELIGRIEL